MNEESSPCTQYDVAKANEYVQNALRTVIEANSHCSRFAGSTLQSATSVLYKVQEDLVRLSCSLYDIEDRMAKQSRPS